MKRLFKGFVSVLVLAFLAVQFYRPEKNGPELQPGPDDLRSVHPMPASLRAKLEVSCYDCHSNSTRYPWYAEIQPLGWWLDQHVRDGKNELNLSTFGRLSAKRQASRLDAIIDAVNDRSMPLKSYTWSHSDAVFSAQEVAELTAWAEELRDELEE